MTFEDIDRDLERIAERTFQCPRCGGPIPNAEYRGQYPGALSRVADVEICSGCGMHEAMQPFMFHKPVTPRDQWPIWGEDLDDLQTCMEMNRQAMEASKQLRGAPDGEILP